MNTCQRCGRDKVIPRGKLCCTCYRHRKIEQNPELAPKLEGRYAKSRKRVKPDMDKNKVVYTINRDVQMPIKLDLKYKKPSEWQGCLRMGLRIDPIRRKRNKEAHIKGWTGLDPLPMPRVK